MMHLKPVDPEEFPEGTSAFCGLVSLDLGLVNPALHHAPLHDEQLVSLLEQELLLLAMLSGRAVPHLSLGSDALRTQSDGHQVPPHPPQWPFVAQVVPASANASSKHVPHTSLLFWPEKQHVPTSVSTLSTDPGSSCTLL